MNSNKTRLLAALMGATYFSLANMFKHGSPYSFENAKYITKREPKQDNPKAMLKAQAKRQRICERNLKLLASGGFKSTRLKV